MTMNVASHVFPIHVIFYQTKCFSINIAKFSLARFFNFVFSFTNTFRRPSPPLPLSPGTILTVTSNQAMIW